MGLVIASGLTIGTLLTLFVVPAFYFVFAATHAGASVAAPVLDFTAAAPRPPRASPSPR
jgi:multidrug efflux pump